MEATALETIIGGKGTRAIGATISVDNVKVKAVFVREDAPNLKLYRERYAGEVADTEVTADHFSGTTPKAGDLILGFGYNFKKVETGASGSVTLIFAE
jgi:hypothetical protein